MYDSIGTRAVRQREIIQFLYEVKDISFKELSEKMNTTLSTIKAIEKKGLLKIYKRS